MAKISLKIDRSHLNDDVDIELSRLCDIYNVPAATNIATAEVLIMALDRGDLDWREIVNPGANRKPV